MSGFASDDLTQDAYLGGKLYLWQPKRGYRAGVDPVLLAASVRAVAGQSVLELGCGAGAAILCLGARVPGLTLVGVEREAALADLARRNGVNEVATANLTDLPMPLREQQFDHVLANPPFFDRSASRPSHDALREAAHAQDTPLEDWVKAAGKRLKPQGWAHFIHRAERLPDLLGALPQDLGSAEVLPITSRNGRAAERIILRCKKNGRGAFRLHAPVVMHEGDAHRDDRTDDYAPAIRAVLRTGAMLEF